MEHGLTVLQVVTGLVAGVVMVRVYFVLLHKQVERIADGAYPAATLGLGFLVRMALFGGAMALLLWWDTRAGIAYAVSFLVARALRMRRYDRARGSPPGDEA